MAHCGVRAQLTLASKALKLARACGLNQIRPPQPLPSRVPRTVTSSASNKRLALPNVSSSSYDVPPPRPPTPQLDTQSLSSSKGPNNSTILLPSVSNPNPSASQSHRHLHGLSPVPFIPFSQAKESLAFWSRWDYWPWSTSHFPMSPPTTR